MTDQDHSQALLAALQRAVANKQALQLRGGGSKDFYGRAPQGQLLSVAEHSGIIEYEPSELVISARAGTPLQQIEQTLAEHGQMLAFEPPHYGPSATLGGTIACGFSGPRRPFAGAARDFVLGARIINGKGEVLSFGGKVMKNVAGYDLSRLMVGALGTLGVLLDISLKVLPKPESEQTLVRESSAEEAGELLTRIKAKPYPLSAGCYDGERLFLRLSGADSAVAKACKRISGEAYEKGERFWYDVREQQRPFFDTEQPLWRISLPAHAPPLNLPGKALWDWAGAQRWLRSDAPAEVVRGAAQRAGGHASLFRRGDRGGQIFHPLPAPLQQLHSRIKQAMDPQGLLNPGRLYEEL